MPSGREAVALECQAARALGLAAQEGAGLSLGGCTLGPAQPTWNGGRSGICWLPSASLH